MQPSVPHLQRLPHHLTRPKTFNRLRGEKKYRFTEIQVGRSIKKKKAYMATDWKIAMNAFAHKTIFTLNSSISAITTSHVQLFLHFCIIHWAHRIWCNLEAWSACSKILCSALSDPVKYIFVHIFINFDIFHQKETAVVLLSQLDRQTRNFGGSVGVDWRL